MKLRFCFIVLGIVLSLQIIISNEIIASEDKLQFVQANQRPAVVIKNIIVKGAQRVEPSTVQSYLLVRKGDFLKQSRLDRSLKSLFATGLFADVKFSVKGSNLVVSVVENPLINQVAFEGNESREDEDLASEVSLRSRVIYTRTKLQNDVKRILNIYQKTKS